MNYRKQVIRKNEKRKQTSTKREKAVDVKKKYDRKMSKVKTKTIPHPELKNTWIVVEV